MLKCIFQALIADGTSLANALSFAGRSSLFRKERLRVSLRTQGLVLPLLLDGAKEFIERHLCSSTATENGVIFWVVHADSFLDRKGDVCGEVCSSDLALIADGTSLANALSFAGRSSLFRKERLRVSLRTQGLVLPLLLDGAKEFIERHLCSSTATENGVIFWFIHADSFLRSWVKYGLVLHHALAVRRKQHCCDYPPKH